MSESRTQQIWSALDRARGTYSAHDLAGHVDALRHEGIDVGPEDLELLLQRMPSGLVEYFFPVHLARFVAELVAPSSPQSILDPWAGLGILPITVAAELRPATYDVFNKDPTAHALLQQIEGSDALSSRLVEPLEELAKTESQYDAVVSCPPFGLGPAQSISINIDGKPREIRDYYGELQTLRACQLLNAGGLGALFVAPNFMFHQASAGTRTALQDLGFQIRACIEIPAGTFQPKTAISANLVVIECGDPAPTFVAEYSKDERHQETVRSNFRERREGRRAAQGRLVNLKVFKGYSALAASERVYDLAKQMGLEEVPFGSIVTEINQTKSGRDFERLPEKPNSVYLPLMATTPATTSQDRLPEKLKSYLQLEINEDIAEAPFVAGILNTPLGLAIRDAARRGVTIPRIHHRDLRDAPFFLPLSDVQQKVVATQATITRLRNELNELESSLWNRPRSADKVEKAIRHLNKEDRFQDWIDTLPFPFASVLWRFHAYKGPSREAYERLIAFFEVLAQFCAVVHLSAFSSSAALWAEVGEDLRHLLEKQSLSLERATFGTWKCCAEFLSSRARKLLEDSPELCFEMYRTHSHRVLEAIASKKLLGVLQETNRIRNFSSGHVGAVSEARAKHILATLTDHLDRVREVFGDIWINYELLQPLKCKFHEGIFHFDALRIMGTRSMPFKTAEVELTEAMEDGRLHLWSPGEGRALMLLPMIKIMPSPKTEENACYFYNRRQSGGIRFLSYHFEGDAEVVAAFEDTARTLDTLFNDRA